MSSFGGPPRPSPDKPTFLMCPPTLYDVNYVINPWMAGNVNLWLAKIAICCRIKLVGCVPALACTRAKLVSCCGC
jgi:hypothetical protein